MKITDLIPYCVLPTDNHDVLYLHKDDVDKEMSVCLFIDIDSKTNQPILRMHQTQMYLTRSLIDYEIENTEENVQFYLDRLSRKYPDEYIEKVLTNFEKFREEYYSNIKCSTTELFDMIEKYNVER